MIAVLVDSNVVIDVLTEDPSWYGWSQGALAAAGSRARLTINPVIYAEVSIRFETIEDLESALSNIFERGQIPWEAAFLAAKAFLVYRGRGGARASTLPDFFIGAHASVSGMQLLTRDARRYRTYFPGLEIIAPDAG